MNFQIIRHSHLKLTNAFQNDLSRLRQEELPLSNKESRGPSYAPTRKNGTDHIPPEEKAILKSQWDGELHTKLYHMRSC
jgi:hypothetical protein